MTFPLLKVIRTSGITSWVKLLMHESLFGTQARTGYSVADPGGTMIWELGNRTAGHPPLVLVKMPMMMTPATPPRLRTETRSVTRTYPALAAARANLRSAAVGVESGDVRRTTSRMAFVWR